MGVSKIYSHGFFFKKYHVFEFFVNMVLEKGEDCLEREGGYNLTLIK